MKEGEGQSRHQGGITQNSKHDAAAEFPVLHVEVELGVLLGEGVGHGSLQDDSLDSPAHYLAKMPEEVPKSLELLRRVLGIGNLGIPVIELNTHLLIHQNTREEGERREERERGKREREKSGQEKHREKKKQGKIFLVSRFGLLESHVSIFII